MTNVEIENTIGKLYLLKYQCTAEYNEIIQDLIDKLVIKYHEKNTSN